MTERADAPEWPLPPAGTGWSDWRVAESGGEPLVIEVGDVSVTEAHPAGCEDGEQCIYCLRFTYHPGYGCLMCKRGLASDYVEREAYDRLKRCPECGDEDCDCDD